MTEPEPPKQRVVVYRLEHFTPDRRREDGRVPGTEHSIQIHLEPAHQWKIPTLTVTVSNKSGICQIDLTDGEIADLRDALSTWLGQDHPDHARRVMKKGVGIPEAYTTVIDYYGRRWSRDPKAT